uniref:Uncharacterized protein n=1 Tax=Anguilla anguilla TaxID=7936 RepID=A0A0E9Q2C9_ANGAN
MSVLRSSLVHDTCVRQSFCRAFSCYYRNCPQEGLVILGRKYTLHLNELNLMCAQV